jgi:hypothetical protein
LAITKGKKQDAEYQERKQESRRRRGKEGGKWGKGFSSATSTKFLP